VLFLREFIIPRGNKRKRREDGSPKPLGLETVESYVKAIIELYKSQVTLGNNRNGHPRGKTVKDLLDSLARNEGSRKRKSYVDRGIGTMDGGHSAEELVKVANYFMDCDSGSDFRNRVEFLLGHATLTRGQSKRLMKLPGLFQLRLESRSDLVQFPGCGNESRENISVWQDQIRSCHAPQEGAQMQHLGRRHVPLLQVARRRRTVSRLYQKRNVGMIFMCSSEKIGRHSAGGPQTVHSLNVGSNLRSERMPREEVVQPKLIPAAHHKQIFDEQAAGERVQWRGGIAPLLRE
jgi:hypothetical protein